MPDRSFIALVVAILLAKTGEGPGQSVGNHGRAGWSGAGPLLTLVRARFAGDSDGERALAAAQQEPVEHGRIDDLAAAVKRHADLDTGFHEEIRRLVVGAYADPVMARRLPDPSPRI
jgi:hypothetical protein